MPFIENTAEQLLFSKSIGLDKIEPEDRPTTFKQELHAAFRIENSLGSFSARERELPDSIVDDNNFDLWSELTDDEKLDNRFLDAAVLADNVDELNAVRRQQRREQKDRELLRNSYLAPFVAAAFDPINFIPVGGTAYKTYRTGGSILQSAIATGSVAAGTTAAQEALLHQTQIERTFGESAVNVTAATLFGGILGATPKALENLFTRSGHTRDEVFTQTDEVMNPEPVVEAGLNSTTADRSIGAAQVNADPVVRGKVARAVAKFIGIDPLSRSITSDEQATRVTANMLAENPLDMDNPLGTSVESKIKLWDGAYFEAIEGHEKAWKQYKTEEGIGFFPGLLKRRQFNEEVGKAMRNGSDDPRIQAAADSWRSKLYDPLREQFIEAGLLPEDVSVSTALEYLNRVWNKEKIAADLDGFVTKVSAWLDQENAQKGAVKTETERLFFSVEHAQNQTGKLNRTLEKTETSLAKARKQLEEVRRAEKASLERAFLTTEQAAKRDTQPFLIGKRGQRRELGIAESRQRSRSNTLQDRISGLEHVKRNAEAELKRLEAEQLALIKQLEETVAEFPGKSANKVRSAIKARQGEQAKSLTKALKQAVAKIEKFDVEEVETDSLAREIAGRIMSTPDGRLPYDYKLGENSTGGQTNKLSGPFQNRSFNIPDDMIDDFLDNDIELLAGRYLKQTAPDLELMRQFGDVEMKAELKEIEQNWLKKVQAERDPKKAAKLNKQKDLDIESIGAMRDRMRGIYGQTDWDNLWVRAGRVARDLNYMRLLGGVVAASIPDVARIFAAEGIANTFSKGLVPLVRNMRAFKMSAREAKQYGIGTDALMGGRAEIIADVADYSQGGTAFERGVRAAATKFSSVNLMNQWTAGIKQLHAVVTQTRLIGDLRTGKTDPRLEQLGISKANQRNIAQELKNHATKVDGVWLANRSKWNNQDLSIMWGAALRKESDRVIIVPGQEKPLFMSTELGKTVLQFKSFMFSATQRVLISNLQAQDKHYMQGILGLISIGAMSYAFKEWDAGRELSEDPRVWVAEGIDRSGMLGYLMEANNTVEKVSGNGIGLRPLLGIAQPASRYASRSALDSAVGPTFGLVGDIINVAGGALGQREWSDADTRAFRRLLPGQNLSILRQGLDEVEKVINE